MNKSLTDLNIDEEKFNTLNSTEQTDLIINSYYKIMFDPNTTAFERDRAKLAYNVLFNPKYGDYYINSKEDQNVRRR